MPRVIASVAELDISIRPLNCFNHAEIHTIGQLTELSEWDLMALKNFGKVSLAEVIRALAPYGLSLREESKEQYRRRKRIESDKTWMQMEGWK